jgi:hypothetical protein
MGYTNDLLDGLAQTVAAAGIATYRSDGTAYLTTETALSFKNMPDQPDKAIVLTGYGTQDSPNQALGQERVQFWFRGPAADARVVDDLADSVFLLLQGATHLQFGTCHVIQILRISTIPGGQDESRRWERTDNYAIDVNPPATANRNQ